MNHPINSEILINEKINAIRTEGLRHRALRQAGVFRPGQPGLLSQFARHLSKLRNGALRSQKNIISDAVNDP